MRRHRGALVLVGTLMVCAPITHAQQSTGPDSSGTPPIVGTERATSSSSTPDPPREWLGSSLRWAAWSRLTGDWSRLRTRLEDRGLAFEISTTSDGSSVGINRQRLGRALTTTAANVDFEKLLGLKGSRALVQYQFLGGVNAGRSAEIAQTFSNIDAAPFRGLAEAWVEQAFGSGARVKVGLIDANTEFAFVDNAGDFINSSMGMSPTVFPMPTYPDPHVGVTVHLDHARGSYVSAGVFNGGPALGVDDFAALFTVAEAGVRWTRGGGGRAGVGYWRLSGRPLDDSGPAQHLATAGQYIVIDQTLWSLERQGSTQMVGAFVQAGRADPRMSAMTSHVGVGLFARGLLQGRPDDTVGIGVTDAEMSPDASGTALQHEIVFEAFHRFALAGWLALKPDLQIIKNPGGIAGRRAIVAGTMRIEVIF